MNGWREKARAQLGEECSQVFDVHTLTAGPAVCEEEKDKKKMLGVFGITLNIALLSIAVFFFFLFSHVREIAPPAGQLSQETKIPPSRQKRKIYNSEAKTTKLYNQIQITPTDQRCAG